MTQPLHQFKAEFFKALAHPARIRILERLRGGERTVSELQSYLEIEPLQRVPAAGCPAGQEHRADPQGGDKRVLQRA